MRSKRSLYLTALALTVTLMTATANHVTAFAAVTNTVVVNGVTYSYDAYTGNGTTNGKEYRIENMSSEARSMLDFIDVNKKTKKYGYIGKVDGNLISKEYLEKILTPEFMKENYIKEASFHDSWHPDLFYVMITFDYSNYLKASQADIFVDYNDKDAVEKAMEKIITEGEGQGVIGLKNAPSDIQGTSNNFMYLSRLLTKYDRATGICKHFMTFTERKDGVWDMELPFSTTLTDKDKQAIIKLKEREKYILSLMKPGMSDTEKVEIIHNYILDSTQIGLPFSLSSVRVYILSTDVLCAEDFVEPFEYFLKKAGIDVDCIVLTKKNPNFDKMMRYKGVVVRIDGKKYIIDISDDAIKGKRKENFMVPVEDFWKNKKWSALEIEAVASKEKVTNWKSHGAKKSITDSSKSWKINFNKRISNMDLYKGRKVYISTDPNGANIMGGVSVRVDDPGKSITLNYDNKPIWEKGKTYYIFIQGVETIDGEAYKTPLRMEFGIK